MRIFSSCLEGIKEVERDLMEMGTRVKIETYQDVNVKDKPGLSETLELLAYSYEITNTSDKGELLKYMKANKEWVLREFSERLDPDFINPGKAWKLRREVWEPFLHDGKFSYSYNERIQPQIDKIIEELKIHPGSRQCVLPIFQPQDLDKFGKERIPCCIMYQFLIRKNKLNLIYTMRSSDLLTHLVYDIYLAISLQEYVAEKLKIEVGNFYHFISSLHAYRKDLEIRGIF